MASTPPPVSPPVSPPVPSAATAPVAGQAIADQNGRDRPAWVAPVAGLAAFVLAALAIYLGITSWDGWIGERRFQRTEDAYLQADLTPIAARVAGYVRSVPAQDFQSVQPGQLLVQIDDDDYRASYDQALGAEAVAKAAIGNLVAQQRLQHANIQASVASLMASRALSDRAAKAAHRQNVLLQSGSGSQDQHEAADAAKTSAAAQVDHDNAVRQAAVEQLVVLGAQIHQAKAAVEAAHAASEVARINLGHTKIIAPQHGVLGQRQVRPGQYLAVGAQVTTLTPLPHVWVIANFRETQMTHIRPGQHVKVSVDAYPGHTITGHVSSYAPGTGAQFSLLPPDNATGNFTKIVQRVAVKIVIDDPASLASLLVPGMSVLVTVDTGAR